MKDEKEQAIAPRIRLNDGYLGEPIWIQPDNDSTYYSHAVDTQCSVPVRNRTELIKELNV